MNNTAGQTKTLRKKFVQRFFVSVAPFRAQSPRIPFIFLICLMLWLNSFVLALAHARRAVFLLCSRIAKNYLPFGNVQLRADANCCDLLNACQSEHWRTELSAFLLRKCGQVRVHFIACPSFSSDCRRLRELFLMENKRHANRNFAEIRCQVVESTFSRHAADIFRFASVVYVSISSICCQNLFLCTNCILAPKSNPKCIYANQKKKRTDAS